MIKIQNNTFIREPIPAFLQGLELISLADLSWTDPSLGVSDCKWLPEQEVLPKLGQFEVYGDETFTLDNGVVIVTRSVLPMSQEQIDFVTSEEASKIRSERNKRLSETDWTQLADSKADKNSWATYRQSLRDITSQSGFPYDVIWPESPQ